MPGPKRTLSIFSFSKTQKRFLKYCLGFFIPVIIAYFILELLVLNIPINYKVFGTYLDTHSQEIEVMALGSSQMKCGFNPAVAVALSVQKTFCWSQLWIYFVGPIVGSILAAIVFNYINEDDKPTPPIPDAGQEK